ncbi:MAG: hypothetical protein Kow00117_17000 [Phototrophicales bacterium]
MTDYVDVTVDVLGQTYPAKIQRDLKFRGLVQEIRKEFAEELKQANLEHERFALWLKGGFGTLDLDKTIMDIGVNRKLVFGTEAEAPRRKVFSCPRERIMMMPSVRIGEMLGLKLVEERTKREYEINWMPIVIGREGFIDMGDIRQRGIDEQIHPEAITVSRDHAALVERDGQYYIVPLRRDNPTYLANLNERLEYERAYMLQAGDKIRLGDNPGIVLTFTRT